jgi:bifunctional DNase/RNase
MMLRVTVESVRASLMSPQRLVVLKTDDGPRYLPIWIGSFEADAIAMELQGMEAPRPMSHDLLKETIIALGGKLSYVVIHDLQHDVFFANVVLERDGKEVKLDSRPSDSIALAVRCSAPIFVHGSVMERAGISRERDVREPPLEKPEPDEGSLEVFREFIEELSFDSGAEDNEEGA